MSLNPNKQIHHLGPSSSRKQPSPITHLPKTIGPSSIPYNPQNFNQFNQNKTSTNARLNWSVSQSRNSGESKEACVIQKTPIKGVANENQLVVINNQRFLKTIKGKEGSPRDQEENFSGELEVEKNMEEKIKILDSRLIELKREKQEFMFGFSQEKEVLLRENESLRKYISDLRSKMEPIKALNCLQTEEKTKQIQRLNLSLFNEENQPHDYEIHRFQKPKEEMTNYVSSYNQQHNTKTTDLVSMREHKELKTENENYRKEMDRIVNEIALVTANNDNILKQFAMMKEEVQHLTMRNSELEEENNKVTDQLKRMGEEKKMRENEYEGILWEKEGQVEEMKKKVEYLERKECQKYSELMRTLMKLNPKLEVAVE